MRVYWKQPLRESRIVRPDNEGDEYEVWVLEPRLVGTLIKAGNQRYLVNGMPHSNINAAARTVLEGVNENELAGELRMNVRAIETQVKVSGLDLVERNAWTTFCTARSINPRSVQDMNKTYTLTQKEATALGLAKG